MRRYVAPLRGSRHWYNCCLYLQQSSLLASASCGLATCRHRIASLSDPKLGVQSLHTSSTSAVDSSPTPFRKQLKDEARQRKHAPARNGLPKQQTFGSEDPPSEWELTVGIEIHAELDTATKLFSPASTSISDDPNTHVALFDAAFPGSQPKFQGAVLLPALRAALALNCSIQRQSSFDRKHYFYQDQPGGYQITQYYEPFARFGSLTLTPDDGIDGADFPKVTVPIKQIQLEQDTAKTIYQPPSTYLIDFNRVSHPLIEIISMPAIHSPATAAAYVRKVQAILKAVGAVTAGMEVGGMRADVNVSVRRHGTKADCEYHGFTGLGTRTEIKNLSSVKSVSDAIALERDRQIALLRSGAEVESETRAYVVGGTQTTKLRSKEGGVDYRYMPDPDIPPLLIGEDLIAHLQANLPSMPDEVVDRLVQEEGLTIKDAKTLREADDGERLEYFYAVLDKLLKSLPEDIKHDRKRVGKTTADWIIHELGSLLTTSGTAFSCSTPRPHHVVDILNFFLTKQITVDSARDLFARCFQHSITALVDSSSPTEDLDVSYIIQAENLKLETLPDSVYEELAAELIAQHPAKVEAIRDKGQKGKLMWFVGQMMRSRGKGQVKLEAQKAEAAVRRLIGV